jgi:hypothetical protein
VDLLPFRTGEATDTVDSMVYGTRVRATGAVRVHFSPSATHSIVPPPHEPLNFRIILEAALQDGSGAPARSEVRWSLLQLTRASPSASNGGPGRRDAGAGAPVSQRPRRTVARSRNCRRSVAPTGGARIDSQRSRQRRKRRGKRAPAQQPVTRGVPGCGEDSGEAACSEASGLRRRPTSRQPPALEQVEALTREQQRRARRVDWHGHTRRVGTRGSLFWRPGISLDRH